MNYSPKKLYKVVHFTGVYKVCSREQAQTLVDTGKWHDKTIYHNDEEKKNALRNVQLRQEIERKESGYQYVDATSGNGVNSINSQEDRDCVDKKQKDVRQKDEVLKTESSEKPRPKRRGRPPKIKVSDNATNSKNSK
jgi:hypothetical protein